MRIVAHVDMDAFYAAVEAQRDPAHLELGERTWLCVAAATPVTRPRLFDAEALARFNWGF